MPESTGTTERHLPDGTPVRLRALRPEDRPGLADRFTQLSPQSRYRRFLTGMPALSEKFLRYLVDGVDGRRHVALLLVAMPPEGPVAVGIGRFVRDATDPTSAELAITVDDAWQGRGVGTVLVDALAEVAGQVGIRSFTATTLAENVAAVRLLQRAGRLARAARQDATVDLRVDLPGQVTGRP